MSLTSTSTNASQVLAARQALVLCEVVEEVFDITAEALGLASCYKRKDRRAPVWPLVELPA